MEENEIYTTESNEERLMMMAYLSANGYTFSESVWSGCMHDWEVFPTIVVDSGKMLTLGPRSAGRRSNSLSKVEMYSRLNVKIERKLTPHKL